VSSSAFHICPVVPFLSGPGSVLVCGRWPPVVRSGGAFTDPPATTPLTTPLGPHWRRLGGTPRGPLHRAHQGAGPTGGCPPRGHGWSITLRHTGSSDVPLEPEGREQARAVGPPPGRAPVRPGAVSPLERPGRRAGWPGFADAQVCDRPAGMGLRRLRGAHDGRHPFAASGMVVVARRGPRRGDPGRGGRPGRRVVARVRAVRGTSSSSPTAHILRVVAAVAGAPGRRRVALVLSPASVSVLGWERETPVIERWNDTGGEPLA